MNSIVTQKDMDILQANTIYNRLSDLPLQFYYGGKDIHGIPEGFKTEITKEQKDGMVKTVYSALDSKGLLIRYEVTQYLDFPVVEYVAFFTNTADTESDIVAEPCAFRKTVLGTNPRLTYGTGDTTDIRGYQYTTQDLLYMFHLSPADGNPCNGASPFMKLNFDEFNMRLAVGWPGTWKMSMYPELEGVNLGVTQKRCYIRLKAGETIRTPSLTIMCYQGDDNKGINLWRRWYFAHIMPKKSGKRLEPMITGHSSPPTGVEFIHATEKQQLDGINEFLDSGLKPDVWWIDAGWYPCGSSWTNTGDLYADPERFPNSLKPIGQRCKEIGCDFLVWFEPERAKRGRQLTTEHPQWYLPCSKHLYKGKMFEDCLINLGDPECVEWLIDTVSTFLKENHVTIYRQDFNLDLQTMWRENESEERYGAVENAHVQGYLKYWDGLLERVPGLLIDSCAGGGRRNDMETIKRGVPFHYSDVGYGIHPVRQQQLRMMNEWIPFYRCSPLDWRDEKGIYHPFDSGRTKDPDLFTLRNNLAPVTSLEANRFNKVVLHFIPVWRKAAQIMMSGDYYPLTECHGSPREFYAAQFEDPETKTGFIQVVNNSCNPDDRCVLRPHFAQNAVYTFEESNNDGSFEITDDGRFIVTMQKANSAVWFYSYQ